MSPSPQLSKTHRRKQGGMTLVELLTSMVIASLIMLVLLQSLSSATDSWVVQSKNFSAQREARTGLKLMADDFAAMVVLPRRVEMETDRFILRPSSTVYDSSRMAFLRATKTPRYSDSLERGDIRLVMYGVVLTPDGGTSSASRRQISQKLIRRVMSAEETYRRIRDHLEMDQPLINESDWDALKRAGNDSEPLAFDVIRFDVKAYENLDEPAATGAWPQDQVPSWVDLTLRVTNRQTAQLLNDLTDWRGHGDFSHLITNGTPMNYDDDSEVRTFTMRLRPNASSL